MEMNEQERKAILKRNLRAAGIMNLIPNELGYIFAIETITGINLKIIAELTGKELIMVGILNIEVNTKDKPMMLQLGEYINISNAKMALGKLILDYEEGNIWFSVSTRYYNEFLEKEAYEDMIDTIIFIVDCVSSGIIDIVTGISKNAKEAYINSKSAFFRFLEELHI